MNVKIRDLSERQLQYGLRFKTEDGITGRVLLTSVGVAQPLVGQVAPYSITAPGTDTLLVYVTGDSAYGFCYQSNCDFTVILDSLRDIFERQNAASL